METDLYENQYLIHKDFFLNGIYKYESNEDTRKFFANTSEFFTQKTEVNVACYQLTKLFRYYVFRKKGTNDSKKKKGGDNKVAKEGQKMAKEGKKLAKEGIKKAKEGKKLAKKYSGGAANEYIFNDATDLFDPTKFLIRDIQDGGDYSFLAAVHDILKTHEIIPANVSMNEFYDDISYGLYTDANLDENKIHKLSADLSIKHGFADSDMSSEVALSGLNLLLIKKDCDGTSNVEKYGPNKKINKNVQTSILYDGGDKYYPVYENTDDGLIGMFDTKSQFIKDLIKKN